MVKRKEKKDLTTVMVYIIMFDLIFGGSGRILEFGALSLRIILFALLLVVFILNGRFYNNKANLLIVAVCVYWIMYAVISIFINPANQVITELKGYIPILLCPVFVWYFLSHRKEIDSLIRFFRMMIRLLSVLQLAVWLYAFIKGMAVYGSLTDILNKYDYGLLSFIDSSNTIPRLFFKTSIFIFIGVLFEIVDVFKRKDKMRFSVVFAVLELIAFITTFTLGFWAAGIICAIFFFIMMKKKKGLSYRSVFIIFICIIIAVVLFIKFDLYQMFVLRFNSVSVAYKFSQFSMLFELWLKKPLFGYGFGRSAEYVVNGVIETRFSFENVWMQILFHNGIIGFLLFISMIVYACVGLNRMYKKNNNINFLIFEIGLIYICIVSLFNPFINNSIGMVYIAFCMGLANLGYLRCTKKIESNLIKSKKMPLLNYGENI